MTPQKIFRDFEIGSKISVIHDFLGTIRHPFLVVLVFIGVRSYKHTYTLKIQSTVCCLTMSSLAWLSWIKLCMSYEARILSVMLMITFIWKSMRLFTISVWWNWVNFLRKNPPQKRQSEIKIVPVLPEGNPWGFRPHKYRLSRVKWLNLQGRGVPRMLIPTKHFVLWQLAGTHLYSWIDRGTVKGTTCPVYKVLYNWPSETIIN